MKNLVKQIGRGIAPLVLGGALALGAIGCSGNQPKSQGLFYITPERAQELKNIPEYQLSDNELCQLAEQSYGFYKTKRESLDRTSLGETFVLGDEKIQPCYINKVYPGKQTTDIIFSVQKPQANATYKFDFTDGRVTQVNVTVRDGSFERTDSFFPDDKEAMSLAKKNINTYLDHIESERKQNEKKQRKNALEALK